jgi:hypothetical protein
MDTYHARLVDLRRAAEALGIGIPDPPGGSGTGQHDPGTAEHLRLAAAVGGAAEGLAMVCASRFVTSRESHDEDPAAIAERTAFETAGMSGRDTTATKILWAIWLLRRLQVRASDSSADVSPVSAAAITTTTEALHALLSAVVYERGGAEEDREGCLRAAATSLRAAQDALQAAAEERL